MGSRLMSLMNSTHLSQPASIHLQTFRQVRDSPPYHRQETLTMTCLGLYDNKTIQKE
jgi:hypothetical protein